MSKGRRNRAKDDRRKRDDKPCAHKWVKNWLYDAVGFDGSLIPTHKCDKCGNKRGV